MAALHVATGLGSVAAVRTLLSLGADPTSGAERRNTAVDAAFCTLQTGAVTPDRRARIAECIALVRDAMPDYW